MITRFVSDRPIVMAGTGMSGLGLSTMEMLTPYIQFGVLVGSLFIVGLTVVIKLREVIKGGKK